MQTIFESSPDAPNFQVHLDCLRLILSAYISSLHGSGKSPDVILFLGGGSGSFLIEEFWV